MNEKNMEVLTNIIGAVESGGQVYGKRRYDAYAAKGQNSTNEKTCTLGWAQNYGSEARQLCQMIFDRDPGAFRKADSAGIEAKQKLDWVAAGWNPSAKEKAALIAIITTEAGKKCQDELFAKLMQAYIKQAEQYGVASVPAQMMWCEIEHLGGYSPVKRIFDRAAKPYTPDTIFASLLLDQKDTSNDNQVGDKKFQSRHECCVKWIKQFAVEESQISNSKTEIETKIETKKETEKQEETEMAVHYISNSGSDENGSYHGGAAGDQTGKEWQLRSWYNRPWSCVLRHPDAKVREKIAELATKAAKNDKIGYDQYQRETYWQQLQLVGYDPSKIKVACEADCSAGVIANVKATGHILGITKLKDLTATYTGNMRSSFKAAGFEVLTASKYLTSPDYLLPGDILLNDTHHTATNITKGAKADGGSTTSTETDNSKYLPGTCTVTLETFLIGAQHPQVKSIQRILKSLGYKGKDGKALAIDGELGENTAYAIEAFQKAKGMEAINYGTVAAKTWSLLLNA